ncbi:MAG: glycosyltransferase family 4 protein, partial [Candidatus Kapabacteria bacterium]|nr:glycosyltransferase family 4 protein [Candidatus Kapabacteria bacterium]
HDAVTESDQLQGTVRRPRDPAKHLSSGSAIVPSAPVTDVLLVALADVSRDARTLNLARALSAEGLRVTIMAAAASEDHQPPAVEGGAGIDLIQWSDPGGRAARRWWSLRGYASRQSVRARLVVAMDLFALSAAAIIAQRSGARLVYDMRELYFALGPLEGKGLKQRLLEMHERSMLRRVHRVIVSGELDADLVQQRYGLTERPFVLLNTPPYRDVVASDLRRRCGVSAGTPLAIYQGVVHHGRGLAPMFRAMALRPDLHLAIVGNGPAEADLRGSAKAAGVSDRVHWLGSVPYDQLHALTCGADVGLCLIEPLSLSYEVALPNKVFEYMMARIPVLASDLPALRSLVEQHPIGPLVDRALLPEDIDVALSQVFDPGLRAAMTDACEASRDLCYERQSQSSVQLIRDLLT